MSELEKAQADLLAFAATQGWEIRSGIFGDVAILATIYLSVGDCNTCGRPIYGTKYASLGLSMLICGPCYELQESGKTR